MTLSELASTKDGPLAEVILATVDYSEFGRLQPILVRCEQIVGRVAPVDGVVQEFLIGIHVLLDNRFGYQLSKRPVAGRGIQPCLRYCFCFGAGNLDKEGWSVFVSQLLLELLLTMRCSHYSIMMTMSLFWIEWEI